MKKQVKTPQVDVATLQPSELGELKIVVKEFLSRLENLDNEIAGLKEDRKALYEEFSEKLDVKTLATAMKVLQIESTVAFKGNYDSFVEVLKDDFVNNLTNS